MRGEGSNYSIGGLTRHDALDEAAARGAHLPLPPGPPRRRAASSTSTSALLSRTQPSPDALTTQRCRHSFGSWTRNPRRSLPSLWLMTRTAPRHGAPRRPDPIFGPFRPGRTPAGSSAAGSFVGPGTTPSTDVETPQVFGLEFKRVFDSALVTRVMLSACRTPSLSRCHLSRLGSHRQRLASSSDS